MGEFAFVPITWVVHCSMDELSLNNEVKQACYSPIASVPLIIAFLYVFVRVFCARHSCIINDSK